MVTFEKGQLLISLKTTSAAEDWLSIVHELIGLLQSENALQENGDSPDTSRFFVLELLREMMPTWEQMRGLEN